MDRNVPGWQHEIVGWVLVTGVPSLVAAALFGYLTLAAPSAIETPLWVAGTAAGASVLAGFSVWIRGVVLARRERRRPPPP